MKIHALKIAAPAVSAILSLSLLTMAGEKKTALTYLDTLNKGRELSISTADFAPPPQSPAIKTGEAPADTAAAEIRPVLKKEAGVVVSRFRIQVLASTQQEQVKREKAVLASRIDIPVSISFESPYYKLFAGDFAQRSEAENYLAQVKKIGYNDAWISRTASAQK